jgi:Flp pilus assembly protein TadD
VFNAYVNIGGVLLEQGDFTGAVDAFRQAVRSDPHNANGHCQLGVALSSLGRLDEAVEAYREALRLDPNHVRARRGLDRIPHP